MQMRARLVALGMAGLTILSAQAADLFVDSTGAGGAYTTIQTAFTAASANDTIWVRGGQSFNGAGLLWTSTKNGVKLYGGWDGSMATPQSYAFTSANDPTNIANPNPARTAETIWTGGQFVNISVSAGAVDGVTLRGFNFATTVADQQVINCDASGAVSRQNIDVSNNIFAPTVNQGFFNAQSAGSGATIENVLFSGNRLTHASTATAKTFVYIGGGPWNTGSIRRNITIVDNYMADNGPATANNRGTNMDGARDHVTARNYVDDVSAQSFGSIHNGPANVVVAENHLIGGAGVSAGHAAMWLRPGEVSGQDFDAQNILISNNHWDNLLGFPAFYITTHSVFPNDDDGLNNVVLRHNLFDLPTDRLQTPGSATANIRAINLQCVSQSDADNNVLFENNDVNLTGTRAAAVQALGITGDPNSITVRHNKIVVESGSTSVGLGIDLTDATFGNGTACSIDISNNLFQGFGTGVGPYESYYATPPASPDLVDIPVGNTVNVQNNNFVSNTLGIHGGNTGAGVDITGSYFSGNAADTQGITAGTPGGSANTVAGRNAAYVTFRGDHNLSNDVDGTDAGLIVTNFGASGPDVTYFKGDSTLDQEVTLDDGKVYARFVDEPIAGIGAITDPASAGAPTIGYDPLTGNLTFTLGTQTDIWGISLLDGATVLAGSFIPTALNANWFGGDVGDGLELGDQLFGQLGDFATSAPNTVFGAVQSGLSAADFGQIEYYFGRDGGVSSKLTGVTIVAIPEPATLAVLGLGGLALLRRRR